jgi:hypothetical protein
MAAPLQLPVQYIEHQVRQQRREHSPNAKANFQFERVVRGWRDAPVLDLRLKK